MSKDKDIEEIIKTLPFGTDNEEFDDVLNSLLSTTQTQGLDHSHFIPLIDFALSRTLNEIQSETILESLVPRTKVPSEAVITAISYLSTNQHSIKIQLKIVEWISRVFDDIDDIKPIHPLYDIVFHYIETKALSSHVESILSKMTLERDVKCYRIQKLLQACRKHISPIRSSVLMNKFHALCSEKVEQTLETNLISVQKSEYEKDHPDAPKKKRRKVCANSPSSGNPETSINQIQTSLHGPTSYSARLGIGDEGFPTSPLTLLQDPHALLDLYVKNDVKMLEKLDTWLKFFLIECCGENNMSHEWFATILANVSNFQHHIQEGLPSSATFLKRFFKSVNFDRFLVQGLELVTWVPIRPILELYEDFIEPLIATCFRINSKRTTVLIIYTLTNLLRNFAFVEMNKRNSTYISVFNTENHQTNIDSQKNVIKFISNVSEFIAEILKDASDSSVLHSIIAFYELMPDLHLKYGLPIIELLPQPIIEICLLSCNAFPIARLCALICRYKLAFKSMKQRLENKTEPVTEVFNRSLSHIKPFNKLLLLTCDILFRNQSFMSANSSFYLTYETLDLLPIAYKHEKFNLCNHAAFTGFAFQFLMETHTDNEINTLRCFLSKPLIKARYFEFLKKWNLNGIVDFCNDFISKKSSKCD